MPQAGGLSGLMGELWGARMGREPASAAVAPPPAPAAADANELNAQLVSRILVSAPAQGGDPEVRIKLSEALLPGAEVRLSRGTDGMLSVTLVADRPEAFQTLVAAQGSLKSALEAQDKSQVRVAVEHAAAQDGSGGDPNRRSATYAAYPADGGAQ
jgi:type III secretion system needle length determinant